MHFKPCQFCGSTRVKILLKANALPCRIPVLRCADCRTVFFESVKKHDDYWRSQKHREIYEEEREVQREEFAGYLPDMAALKPDKGILLDVGSGMGDFLVVAAGDGWKVEGVEPGAEAVQAVRRQYGFTVYEGFFESADIPHNYADCLTMWDVIEHLYDPMPCLKKVAAVLKPGGIFVFKTPNEDSLFKRAARWLYRGSFGLIKFPLKYVYYIPHYFSYSPTSIRKVFPALGFEVALVRYEETDAEFAGKKIDLSYSKYKDKKLVKFLLPWAYRLSRWTGMRNKMIIIARKVGAAEAAL